MFTAIRTKSGIDFLLNALDYKIDKDAEILSSSISKIRHLFLVKKRAETPDNHTFDLDASLNPIYTPNRPAPECPQLVAAREHEWAMAELVQSQIELIYHDDADQRAVATKACWQAYRRNLRNYTTTANGFPELTGEEKPIRPTAGG